MYGVLCRFDPETEPPVRGKIDITPERGVRSNDTAMGAK
jgi:hypothetical protein